MRLSIVKRFTALAAAMLFASTALLQADTPTTRPIADFAKPTLITLKLQKASLKDAMAALEKASTFKVAVNPPDLLTRPDETGITLDVTDRPWMEVLMDISQQANLAPANYADNWTLTTSGDRRLRGRRWLEGPVLVSCNSVQVESDIRYGEPNRTSRNVTLVGLVAIEPRVALTTVSEVRDVVAIDERGRELPGTPPDRTIYMSGAERRDFRFGITMPDDPPTKLVLVRGTLIASTLAKSVDLKIPDVLHANGQKITVNGADFTVNNVEKSGSAFIVEIEATAGNFAKDTFTRIANGQMPINARLGEERRIGEVRINQQRVEGDRTIIMLYIRPMDRRNANDETPNVTLTWSLPVAYEAVSIPFEFKDIPLPK